MARGRLRRAKGGRRFSAGRILVALVIAAFSVVSYCTSRSYNDVTEENQFVGISPEQEIALGLQAAPETAQQHGGLHPDAELQRYVDAVCQRIIDSSEVGDTEWPFECHLLADEEAVNAFASPGGQMFITGAVTLLLLLIAYPLATGGSPWTVLRFIAAIVLGNVVLPPPTTFHALTAVTGVIVHLILSIFYGVILALIIHRWGIIVGFFGGALFGVGLFLINLFALTNLFEWFYPLRSWAFFLLHLFFGALAGGSTNCGNEITMWKMSSMNGRRTPLCLPPIFVK